MDKDTVFGTDDGTITGKPVLNDKQSHIYWQNKCQEQGKEIESLKVENNNLLVMVSNQQKEIETLRERVKTAEARSDEAVQEYQSREIEWKRRLMLVKEWSIANTLLGGFTFWERFLAANTEAAEWFEEE